MIPISLFLFLIKSLTLILALWLECPLLGCIEYMIEYVTRDIQYFGIARIPENQAQLKFVNVYADIVRPPLQTYLNTKSTVPKTFYGYVQALYRGRIVAMQEFCFDNQVIFQFLNQSAYLKEAVSCTAEANLESFANLGSSLGLIVIKKQNPIFGWTNPPFLIDEVYCKLLTESTRCRLVIEYEYVDGCGTDFPTPPPSKPPFPPGRPIPVPPSIGNEGLPPVSPAYDGQDDGGLTYRPVDGLRPPLGDECVVYTVEYSYTFRQQGQPTSTLRGLAVVYGVIDGIRAFNTPDGNFTQIIIDCGGGVPGTCQAGTAYVVESLGGSSGGAGTSFAFENPFIIAISQE